jgi:hypothetical protein
MALNTSKIDAQIAEQQERIKKLQELKKLASDPEMLTLLESLVAQNGNGHKPQSAKTRRHKKHRKGHLLKATQKAIGTLVGTFTVHNVVEAMQHAGFNFAAQKPAVAVGSVLRKLAEQDKLTLAVEGSGRAAHQYEKGTKPMEP